MHFVHSSPARPGEECTKCVDDPHGMRRYAN